MKKKQSTEPSGAMEFLMTYGWAILVVLAAIGALAYFGVLTPCRFTDTCAAQEQEQSACGLPTGEDYDECMQVVLGAQATQICSDLVTIQDPLNWYGKKAFRNDVETLESRQPINILPMEAAYLHAFEVDADGAGERSLWSVECRTPAQACPRDCEVEKQDGCWCYDIHMRTYMNQTQIEEVLS